MFLNPTKQELENRITNLFKYMNNHKYDFDTIIIINKINQYYFTGTMQDGILIIKKNGSIFYFVRKSFQRAKDESPLNIIYKISSYKDILKFIPSNLGNTFLETEITPLALLERLKKHFTMDYINPIDKIILKLRSVKSDYELDILTKSGKMHQYLLENVVPKILREGISETEFATEIYSHAIKLGHHGVSRFSMFQAEMIIGQIGFGINSMYPTNFDGPGGMLGMCPAVPIIGNRNTFLKKGDIIFVDVGFGLLGYHSDKTQIYSFKANPDSDVIKIHNACIDVLNKTASQLITGNIPSKIYKKIMDNLPNALSHNFMGYGNENVKFLGHGIGLHVDEIPVIAKGFNNPLKENMVIALEPKCSINDIGNVGVEETYIVKSNNPICITGGPREIIVV